MSEWQHLISVADLAANLEQPGWRVVDCRFDLEDPDRGRAEFAAGHVPGAVYAHLDHDLAGPVSAESGRHPLPDPAAFAATVAGWGISNDSQVVAYDGGPGALAARLWWMLRWLGHDRVAVLDGGYAAWEAAGEPVETAFRQPAGGSFRGQPRRGATVETAEIEARLAATPAAASPLPLVDAREPGRFAGREEPIDPVAGHVPGALNFPFAQNLSGDGRWRPGRALAADWQRLLGADPPRDWAVMCGSGVTACHLALSAAVAGLPAPRLYVGSWSKWIRDPRRPTAP
ncbi:MAG: sulfurtransferase [Woeseiaceae bacterium]|nr:sulfurtransferase [Woeseiaceae bacterium]